MYGIDYLNIIWNRNYLFKFLTWWRLHEPRNSQKYKTTHVRNTFFCVVSVYFFINVCFCPQKGGRFLWFPKVSVHLDFFAWITFCKVRKETSISDVLQNKIRYTRHIWSLLILCWRVEMWMYSNFTYLTSTFTFCSITLWDIYWFFMYFWFLITFGIDLCKIKHYFSINNYS